MAVDYRQVAYELVRGWHSQESAAAFERRFAADLLLQGQVADIAAALQTSADDERERAAPLVVALTKLVDAVAGDQRDPTELARALGKEAPFAIQVADAALKNYESA